LLQVYLDILVAIKFNFYHSSMEAFMATALNPKEVVSFEELLMHTSFWLKEDKTGKNQRQEEREAPSLFIRSSNGKVSGGYR
jgi:hypothetical protein